MSKPEKYSCCSIAVILSVVIFVLFFLIPGQEQNPKAEIVKVFDKVVFVVDGVDVCSMQREQYYKVVNRMCEVENED